MITIRTLPKFDAWLAGLCDGITKYRLVARLRKAQLGNVGDVKPVGDGIFEMREHFGAWMAHVLCAARRRVDYYVGWR